jgi:hypothetical protein
VIKRPAVAVAVFGLMLMLAGPSLGVEITQPLPISSQDFGVDTSGNCHGIPAQHQLDWHFVLEQSATDDQTLTVTFQNAGVITVSPDEVTANFHLDYDVYTTGDDTLLAASTSGDTGILVLKDICSNPPPPGVELKQPLPISSQDFGADTSGMCHGTPTQFQLDWHFVLKKSPTDDQTLTVTFQNAGTITVSPDEVTANFHLDYDVYTTGDDTLLAASTSGDTGVLVLKEICSNQ